MHFAYVGTAIALIPVGVLFAFIPGPAVLFFALSAALFATQSLWLARRLDRASALAAAERCRALLAGARGDADAAFSALERALAHHDRVPIPFDRARTLVALGEVSRRAKRRRGAREALEGALGEFERLGAEVWVARARADLARVGGRAPSRAELTPAERQIAALVARGHRTKEVAAQLFLSPKTVEGHLSRIYGKLGVRSRTELARRFSDE